MVCELLFKCSSSAVRCTTSFITHLANITFTDVEESKCHATTGIDQFPWKVTKRMLSKNQLFLWIFYFYLSSVERVAVRNSRTAESSNQTEFKPGYNHFLKREILEHRLKYQQPLRALSTLSLFLIPLRRSDKSYNTKCSGGVNKS